MTASQNGISGSTKLGAEIIPGGGATFRVWAPRAKQVYINGFFGGQHRWSTDQDPSLLLQKDSNGYWGGYIPDAKDGDEYKFYIVGNGSSGHKRDPYARELGTNPAYPKCNCIIRDPALYPWHDSNYRAPRFNDMVIYQFHVGTFFGQNRTAGDGKFLDVIDKIEYLADLGFNAIQPLPVHEYSAPNSMGYDGSDIFSAEMDYLVPEEDLPPYLTRINALFQKKGVAPIQQQVLSKKHNQLKVLIDLCHLYGIAVLFDVVYNHASSDIAGQDESIYYFDRDVDTGKNGSLYFTDQDHCGPVFAIWKQEVRQFLIDNVKFWEEEYHVDGFRYDQTSVIVKQNTNDGWRFCQDLTSTAKFIHNTTLHIAEYWPVDPYVVRDKSDNGANFDACWYDGVRNGVWQILAGAAIGAEGKVIFDNLANTLAPAGFPASWKGIQYIESHDEVRVGKGDRIPRRADGKDQRSWYARSRSKVAEGLCLTAAGIPMKFMGEEFLEDKCWSDNPGFYKDSLIYWDGLATDKSMSDHHRFTRDLVWLRRNLAGLRGDRLQIIHMHNDNRIIAFHRWVEGVGYDVVVVASLNEETFYGYDIGFPKQGRWEEKFNSNVYENWVNPKIIGNAGQVYAGNRSLHGMHASASLVIPTNSLLVFVPG